MYRSKPWAMTRAYLAEPLVAPPEQVAAVPTSRPRSPVATDPSLHRREGCRPRIVLFVMVSRIRVLARSLRQEATSPEQLLWAMLRNRRLGGWKFLRQHPLIHTAVLGREYHFIADFYCAAARSVVEVDGGIHLDRV